MPAATWPISITWTQPNPVGATVGYNVYLVNGASEDNTKTFLAFVNGVSTTAYTYSSVTDNTQWQFEVRATDATSGGNEGPALEIFYPNGTSLWTPTTLTPTGAPKLIVRDIAYLTKDEFLNYPNGLKLTNASPIYTTGVLDIMLQSASEQINRMCNRHFGVQTIDEVHQGVRFQTSGEPRLQTIIMNEKPIQNVISVNIQVLKWFIPFSLDYLQVFPEEGFIQIVPFLGGGLTGLPIPSALLTSGLLAKMWVRYTFGYDVIPNAIKLATSLITTKYIGMQENPVSAQSVRFGRNFQLQWDKDNDPIMRLVDTILMPYKLGQYRRPG